MMLVLPSQRLPWEFSKSVLCFLSCLPLWYRPHERIRIVLLLGWQINVPSLELVPNCVPIELDQIAFPIIVLPEGDRTDSFREERLGLPYWTMIWAICVVVDESKCLDIPILELAKTLMHLPFWPVSADTASAACPEHPGSLEKMSMTFAAVIWDADHPCSVNTAYEPESYFTMSPRSTTLPLYFWYSGSSSEFWKMTEIRLWRKMNFSALIPCFFDDFFLVPYFRQLPCRDFLQFFPFFLHCRLCIWNLQCLRHRNEFMHKTAMSHRTHSFCSDVILMRFVSSSF